jgi:hypothetical protein
MVHSHAFVMKVLGSHDSFGASEIFEATVAWACG